MLPPDSPMVFAASKLTAVNPFSRNASIDLLQNNFSWRNSKILSENYEE